MQYKLQSRTEKQRSEEQESDRPGKALILGDVCDVEGLSGVLHVLGVHVVDLTDVTLSVGDMTWSNTGGCL